MCVPCPCEVPEAGSRRRPPPTSSLLSLSLTAGALHPPAAGLLAICLNMAFAVLERLMQRHLMAQAS